MSDKPDSGGGVEQQQFHEGDRLAALLPLPLTGPYDYIVPLGVQVATGDYVEVPLGGRCLPAVVWGPSFGAVDAAKIKHLIRLLPAPPLPLVCRRFVDWVSDYTVQPQGAVLRMMLSVPEALVLSLRAIKLARSSLEIIPSVAQARVLAILGDGSPRTSAELARAARCGKEVVRRLLRAGVLEETEVPTSPLPAPDWRRPGRVLSAAQAEVATALRAAINAGFGVELLHGVPGSGKTDVYFEGIAEALAQGLQTLVLLPEIALGAQWRARFARRFGAPPAEWHSDLSRSHRRRIWRSVAEGAAQVVVGARSALFLPFPRLGLIIVDEEHDSSFKQEEGVAYHARDMAVVRARLGPISCVLVSATPSLETAVNVRAGRYRERTLPERAAAGPAPEIEVIDLRRERPPKGGFVSPALRSALVETFAEGRQAMLFLNRRGYAPLTLCRACGHRLRCPSCTAWMVEHRLIGRLQCHHCSYSRPLPRACPACGAADALSPCGPGVERLAEEMAAIVPDARIALATSDMLPGPSAAAKLVARIERHEVDVIIGTQIFAKGYHFPLLTLVGIIDADLGLAGGDLRAAERTFQLLYQVGGRAGREVAWGEEPGRILLQSVWPKHPVIAALAAGDAARFLAAEEADRRDAGMPPFGRLAALIISARDERHAESAAHALARLAPAAHGVRVLGPAPAPLALLRGRHRRRLLAVAPRDFPLSAWVRNWLANVSLARSVRLQVDIDPQTFL
ncbi:MAG: primosomal protein N' [Rhodospirillales bacterium]|nr:primosomal protein N' [Rhodospirillales bacterium]